MKKWLVMSVIVLILGGCAAQRPKVCVSVYPMEYIVKRIGGNLVDVCQLTKGDYILKAQFNYDVLDDLKSADLIMYFGQLEPYFDIYRDWETDRKSTRLNSSH